MRVEKIVKKDEMPYNSLLFMYLDRLNRVTLYPVSPLQH